MRRAIVSSAMLCFLFISIPGFCQTSSNAQLTGIVTDQSGALIPGVTLTLKKADTGVSTTTVTNEAGVYAFPGLQPGSGYSVTATLPGFQTVTFTNMELGAAVVSSQNVQLKVATAATTVDVIVDRAGALMQSSASVGDVLPEYRIRNLPLVGNNVLDLLNILPGVRFNGTGQWMGDYANTVAGQGLNSLNVTLDGLPTRDERFSAQAGTFQGTTVGGGDTGGAPSGAFGSDYTGGNRMLSTTTINPDLVGEIRLILSPVDAELGRGNSQVQITSRSGTNKYSGSAVWNIQNTSLNPNTWNNNNDVGTALTGCKVKGQTPPCWNPTRPDWRNTNQYTVSFGGPIIRNKTFFYALWDQQISNTRLLQTNSVLTDTARNGVYRYWQGYVPGNANTAISAISPSANNPTAPSVDFSGNPLVPIRWPDGSAYDGSQAGVPAGSLICFSVFGTVKANGSPFGAGDCPSGTDVNGHAYTGVAIIPTGNALWDTKRPDATAAALGYFAKILQEMPKANNFIGGDGLNTSNFRWLRGRKGDGAGVADAIVGSAAYQNRKQINIKIDQNFKVHRIAGGYTHQYDSSTDPAAQWPNGLSGTTTRDPHTFTLNVTSTLSSTLLNEGRFGMNVNTANATNPWNLSDASIRDKARSFMLAGGTSSSGNGGIYPVLVSPASGGLNFDNGFMFTSGAVESLFSNPLYNFADTLSWTRGKHSLKFGGDFRFPHAKGNSLQPIPVAAFGNIGGTNTESPFANVGNSSSLGSTGTPSVTSQAWASNLFPQTARTTASSLEYLFTNSLGSVNTPYWAENYAQVSAGKAGWQDVTTQQERIREIKSSDFAFFVKDDFKMTKNLTLNLGVRYEYYAPPYIQSGLTSTVADQGFGLFGVARSSGALSNWLSPGNLYFTGYGTNGTGPGTNGLGSAAVSLTCSTAAVGTFANRLPAPNCDPKLVTDIQFIGPNSPNPGKTVIPRDRNNIGPAVGFAWQVPWFGEGRTTVRGGYQMTFEKVSIGEGTLASALGGFLNQTASQNDPAVQAIAQPTGLNRAALLTDLPALVPVPPNRAPGQTVPVYGRSTSFTAFDPKLATPYTQNLTLSVTRSVTRQFTLDVRYVGNLTRKSTGNINLNTSTALYNKELFDAFLEARKGGNPALLDSLLAGLDIAPGGGNTTTWTFGTNTGTYPTDRMYGPVGTCTTLVTVAGSQTPTGFANDPHCAPGQLFNYGGDALRRANIYGTSIPLANGTFAALAGVLNGGTAPTGGLQPLVVPTGGTTPSQRVLRNGCDRIANGLYDPSAPAVYPTVEPRATSTAGSPTFGNVTTGNIPTRCFPENYLAANPQLSNATFNGNFGRNNFHSLQAQLSMRPLHGVSFQSTYTWAKSMGLAGSGYNDPLNREFDRVKGNERAHDFRMNGTVELPIGPNKLLFANSSGWFARAIERWQTSFILNLSTGSPASVTGAANTRYAGNGGFQPVGNSRWVPTEHWKIPKGHVDFNDAPAGTATYYGNSRPGNVGSYVNVKDPQCNDANQVAQADNKGFAYASNAVGCTLRALGQRVPIGTPGSFLLDPANPAEVAAVYVLVNPKPGEYGVLTPNVLTSFGNWSLDGNAQKSFRISESKQITIRIDATNVFNHPTPFIPYMQPGGQTGGGQFGEILCGCNESKSGTRTFQGQVRLSF
jgi:hypothetical protein